MDERSFDQLTRVFGAAHSRRRLLRSLAGGALGTVAAAVGFGEASAAKKRSVGNSCTQNSDCDSNVCVTESRTRKICGCPAGLTQCGDACVDAESDINNCGSCGNGCSLQNASAACVHGVCVIASCDAGFADCDSIAASGCETALNTVTNCGSCGHVCPGYQQANDNVTCQNNACTFSCQGEHYDINGDPSDGCETADSATGNHTQGTAAAQGDVSCSDALLVISGTLPSDARVHESPAISGFDSVSGSAPDWYSIHATGGLCQNDIVATLQMTGSANPACYKLTASSDKGSFSAQTNGGGTATINQTNGQYSDDTTILFKVAKTCGPNVIEAPTYTITYHL